ncbi:MAG: hypothetical protein WBG11_15585, partial [Methylocella sp.]
VSNGSPDQKVALLGAISHLSEPSRSATFDALKTGKDGETFAQAGHVATFNPAVAQDVLNGMTILKQEPKFAPKEDDLREAFNKSLPSTDLAIPGARGRILDAAKAYYAAQNFKQGDTSQAFSQPLWDQTVNAVTGGVLDYRGTKIIAPVPSNTPDQAQAQFDQRLQGITDADMHGATLGGVPVPAAALKSSWNRWTGMTNPIRLQTLDPDSGRYAVIAGPAGAPSKVVDPTTGRALVIDLGKSPMLPAPPPTRMPPLSLAAGAH